MTIPPRGDEGLRYARQADGSYEVRERATGQLLGTVRAETYAGRYRYTTSTWWRATKPNGEPGPISRGRYDAVRHLK
jgi:hypothetical protein